MKLKSVRVQNYRSVEDSGEFTVDDITCLVGKNESGKTAILNAMQGIKPFDENMKYDKVTDYPRRHLSAYDERHRGYAAVVCTSKWKLEDDDLAALEEEFGPKCLEKKSFSVKSYYGGRDVWNISINEKFALDHICKQMELRAEEKQFLAGCQTLEEAHQKISESAENVTEKLVALKNRINKYEEKRATLAAIYLLSERMPSFVYFSHYSRMSGELSVQNYKAKGQDSVSEGDRVFNDFLNFAGISLDEIENTGKHEEFTAKLEAASNAISDQIFEYWTQNKNLEVKLEVSEGKPKDPPPFNSGTVVRARIRNNVHRVTVPFSERSAGFIWFFSFLVHFSQVKKRYDQNVIVLLDEPGLTLHAKAQFDLLRYIEEKLTPSYQVIYTTHSPFLILPNRWETIRTVEDTSAERSGDMQGTEVSSDFLKTSRDTIFPLQSAFGYELSQTLFIGKKVLLVEGVSDILYLKTASDILQKDGKSHLGEWVMCPTGGIDKISAFVNLFLTDGTEREIMVLADMQDGHEEKIEKLRKMPNVKKVLLCSEFCKKEEADVEDMLGLALYVDLLKESGGPKVDLSRIDEAKRIAKEVQSKVSGVSHYKPAKWLLQHPEFLTEDRPGAKEALGRFDDLFAQVSGEKSSRGGASKKKGKRK